MADEAEPTPNEASATAPGGYPGGDAKPTETGDAKEPPEAPDGKDGDDDDDKEDKKAVKSSLKRGSRASVASVEERPKVQFDNTRNTVAAYAPSDSSEEWDPNNDDEELDDPQAPKGIAGYLWKKSPSRMVLFKHQKRYFQLKNCKLTWWQDEEGFKKGRKHSKGTVDFKATVITLANDDSSNTRFELKPKSGKWNTGNFTGATDGRVFYLDADGSEQKREQWVEAINLHMNYANQQF